MTMEKKHSVLGYFRRSKSGSDVNTVPVLTAASTTPTSSPSDSPDVTLTPDAGSEYTEKDVNFTSLFMPFIKNYASNFAHNTKNIHKLPYPPCFYYPASSLMHQMNLQLYYIDTLTRANTLTTPIDRFMAVLRYHLSTCSLTKFPYKPIIAFLGETAHSYVVENDGQNATTFYIAEQVEKDPAASAFYICNPTKGVVHEGSVAMVPKFKSSHVHVNFVGQRKTHLNHPQGLWNETYVADVPDLMIRLLRMHTELGGSINLSCAETGLAASIQFLQKPVFGGSKNVLSGKVTLQGREIYQLEGFWDSTIYVIDPYTNQKTEFFNRNTYPKQKVESYPSDQLPDTAGEKVWTQLLETLRRQEFDQAKILKAELDVQGHERLAKYEQQGGFKARYFHKNAATGLWDINDPTLIYSHGVAAM